MPKNPRRLFFLFTILAALHVSAAGAADYTGRLVRVLPKSAADSRYDVIPVFRSEDDSISFAVNDWVVVFLLEQTHKILLSDWLDGLPDEPGIGIRLEEAVVAAGSDAADPVAIVSAGRIFPDWPDSDIAYARSDFDSGMPAPAYWHRYIDVPVDHRDPTRGRFDLYYELCSDFDPDKPTVLVPTDGQRSSSQVGWADRYKAMFGLDGNTVTYEYRGMACSRIAAVSDPGTDWRTLYDILNSDQVVGDIEAIRRDLLGEGRIDVLGGSGTAMIGLKYMARYPHSVRRAFLMSFFKDAVASSEAGVGYFQRFLDDSGQRDAFAAALDREGVSPRQLRFLVQRLLYFDETEVKALIGELAEGCFERYGKYTDMLGTSDFLIRSARKYRPWTVVFMFETNVETSVPKSLDINEPFLEMAAPLAAAMGGGRSGTPPVFDITGLDRIDAEVLLVAGTLDQVAPLEEMQRLHRLIPGSRLAVFEAYHCLQNPDAARAARNGLADFYFTVGDDATVLSEFLQSGAPENGFLRLEP